MRHGVHVVRSRLLQNPILKRTFFAAIPNVPAEIRGRRQPYRPLRPGMSRRRPMPLRKGLHRHNRPRLRRLRQPCPNTRIKKANEQVHLRRRHCKFAPNISANPLDRVQNGHALLKPPTSLNAIRKRIYRGHLPTARRQEHRIATTTATEINGRVGRHISGKHRHQRGRCPCPQSLPVGIAVWSGANAIAERPKLGFQSAPEFRLELCCGHPNGSGWLWKLTLPSSQITRINDRPEARWICRQPQRSDEPHNLRV